MSIMLNQVSNNQKFVVRYARVLFLEEFEQTIIPQDQMEG